MASVIWLIPALPLLACVVIVFAFPRPARAAGYVSVGAIFASFVLSLLILREAIGAAKDHAWHAEAAWRWLTIGNFHLDVGTFVDPIGAVMLTVVCAVSLLVQIYSQGYL